MPDIGNRANVNGPQPIGKVIEPPEDLYPAARHLVDLLMKGDKTALAALSAEDAREDVAAVADSLKGKAYTEIEFYGRARVVKHWWLKVRLEGAKLPTASLQFRLGPDDSGAWIVREMMNLTGVRSGWSL